MFATYAKLVVTAVIWGGTWVAARVAVQEVPPLGVAVWRFLLAAASLLVLVRWHHGRLPALDRRELLLVIGLGATGIFIYNLFFLYGMQHITAGRGALVVATTPVITLLAAAWLLREGMTRLKALGSALALLGCLTVIGRGDPLTPLRGQIGSGDLLILGCALMWSIYTLIGRLGTESLARRNLGALVMTAYASCAGFLMLLVTALIIDPAQLVPHYSLPAWSAIAFLGLLGTTLGFTWFAAAVQKIGAQRASIFINLVPVAAVLQGALLLHERLDPSVLAGGLLVIAGVMLIQRPARNAKEAAA
ncbi:MAG: DMT family transporter [Pseudomonadota bacterium]|uniref:DMT family transporter n=1 Tax=Sulfuricystis thermophila TaxID=2496847 RepID=UPI001035A115|nr:DMT family transporter [Sulfuricystis thermophila]